MNRFGRAEAVVVGSGPNGLAAAIVLASSGRRVLLREGEPVLGGGLRSEELTLPGFVHDVCATVLPLAIGSPFLRTLPLTAHGLSWVEPPLPVAHPFDDGSAAVLHRSVGRTAEGLGSDAQAYRLLVEPLVARWTEFSEALLSPPTRPRHPLLLARFASTLLPSAARLNRRYFREGRTRALFAGLAAHGMMPLGAPLTGSFGMTLAAAGHAVGWPLVRGGSRNLASALAKYLQSLGGEIRTGAPLRSLAEFRASGRSPALLDLTPRQLLRLGGESLPPDFRRRLEAHRYGPGVFKLDWALSAPIPWRASACRQAGTIHLGATAEEIEASEASVWRGEDPEQPYVILVQPSLFDPSRAPSGKHTAWAYCHVPKGSETDMTGRIEAQIERFAPGFRALVLARGVLGPQALETHNPNYVGGDISGGVLTPARLLLSALPPGPYGTPIEGLYLCSSSTPPGGGVHGMCGFHAAAAALRR